MIPHHHYRCYGSMAPSASFGMDPLCNDDRMVLDDITLNLTVMLQRSTPLECLTEYNSTKFLFIT